MQREMAGGRQETEFRRAVRNGYQHGLTPGEIAAATGSTVGSVKATASKIGASDPPVIANKKRIARKVRK